LRTKFTFAERFVVENLYDKALRRWNRLPRDFTARMNTLDWVLFSICLISPVKSGAQKKRNCSLTRELLTLSTIAANKLVISLNSILLICLLVQYIRFRESILINYWYF